MSKIKAIIFDLDGTLIDSVTDLANSVNYTMTELSLQPHTTDEIRSFVGDGVQKLIARSLGEAHMEKSAAAFAIFMNHYGSHLTDNTGLYPGVAEILPQLADRYLLGVLTNKSLQFSRKILQSLGVLSYFRDVVGGDSLPIKKPDPAGIFFLADRWGLDVENEMIMVGDHATDIEVGRRAGCKTVFIEGGIGRTRGMQPDFTLPSMGRLPDLLKTI
jgi:phosphoglycolate phosphatase